MISRRRTALRSAAPCGYNGPSEFGFALVRALSCLFVLLLAGAVPAAADAFGPMKFDTSTPGTIRLEGSFGEMSDYEFKHALVMNPDTTTIVLNSSGGMVPSSLGVADQIHRAGLKTVVPAGSICASACAWVFLAGRERELKGELGVHQMAAPDGSDLDSKLWLGHVARALARYGASPQVLDVINRTPNEDLHIFTAAEVRELGLTTTPVATARAVERKGRSAAHRLVFESDLSTAEGFMSREPMMLLRSP